MTWPDFGTGYVAVPVWLVVAAGILLLVLALLVVRLAGRSPGGR